jgi:hypothetical protein
MQPADEGMRHDPSNLLNRPRDRRTLFNEQCGGAVGAALAQPVQRAEEHRALQLIAVFAFARQLRAYLFPPR